jgi:predicted  nucleic acid-binding Zn-ribbon protein
MSNLPLNKFQITAADFDLEAFNEAVKDVRHTRKQVVEFGSDFQETREKLVEAEEGLKSAMADLNLDEITKLTAECKRLKAKLQTTPVTKVQAFDEAMDKLFAFFDAGCRIPKELTENTEQEAA